MPVQLNRYEGGWVCKMDDLFPPGSTKHVCGRGGGLACMGSDNVSTPALLDPSGGL